MIKWITNGSERSHSMQLVSSEIQKAVRADFLSSALFWVVLSTASLLPACLLVAGGGAAEQVRQERHTEPVRPSVRAEIP
jgi:hypothetical protein